MKLKFSPNSRFIGIILVVLLIGMIIIAGMLIGLTRDMKRQEGILSADNEKNSELIELLKQSVLMLSRDSNQMRSILRLPPTSYPDFREPEPKLDSSESTSTDDPGFFKAIEFIEKEQQKTLQVQEFKKIYAHEDFIACLKATGLSFVHTEDFAGELRRGTVPYFSLSFDETGGTATLKSFTGAELDVKSYGPACSEFLKTNTSLLEEHYKKVDQAVRRLNALRTDRDMQAILAEKKLVFGMTVEDTEKATVPILNAAKTTVLSFALDKRTLSYIAGNDSYPQYEEFLLSARKKAKDIDTRSKREIMIDDAKKSITDLLSDRGFVAYLSSKNLTLSAQPREDSDYFYYDLTKSPSGERIGSFAVQKDIGEIYVMDPDDVPLVSMKTLRIGNQNTEGSKKKLAIPENIGTISGLYKGPSSISFLACGAHENNTDTIMVVYADREKIVIIGFPRDLYWKGRKINSYYRTNGPDYFVKQVAQITGLAIDKYVVIDMFAFIDVVNILGGIDIELSEDLVDPTYKVKNKDGTLSTLFLPKGMHHLDGVETLRVARSRHSSSDFERSARQQQILASLKDQLARFGLKDMGKAYDLVKTLSSYVQTNFTFFELVDLLTRYLNTPIAKQEVLSTKNVLYTTYSNVYLLKEEDAQLYSNSTGDVASDESTPSQGEEGSILNTGTEFDENFDKGEWILLPQNDDWNLIRWYIRTLIGGEKDE